MMRILKTKKDEGAAADGTSPNSSSFPHARNHCQISGYDCTWKCNLELVTRLYLASCASLSGF